MTKLYNSPYCLNPGTATTSCRCSAPPGSLPSSPSAPCWTVGVQSNSWYTWLSVFSDQQIASDKNVQDLQLYMRLNQRQFLGEQMTIIKIYRDVLVCCKVYTTYCTWSLFTCQSYRIDRRIEDTFKLTCTYSYQMSKNTVKENFPRFILNQCTMYIVYCLLSYFSSSTNNFTVIINVSDSLSVTIFSLLIIYSACELWEYLQCLAFMRISSARLLCEYLVLTFYENIQCLPVKQIPSAHHLWEYLEATCYVFRVPTFYENTKCPLGIRIPSAHLLWEYYSAYVFWEYLVLPCYENTQCPSSEKFTMPTCSENISCPPVVRIPRAHHLWKY